MAGLVLAGLMTFSPQDASAQGQLPALKKTWSQRVGSVETMTANGNDLYYSTGDSVGALDFATGKIRWTHSVGPLYWRPAVAYGNGVVYADASGSMLFAYAAKTGAKLWQRSLASDYSHPVAVSGNLLYCQLDRTTLGAIDARTHKTVWKYSLKAVANEDAFNIDCPPVVTDKGIIVGVSEHADADDTPRVLQLLCIAPTGKRVWQRKIDMPGRAWFEQIERAGPLIYASLNRERLLAVDAATGKLAWDVPVPCDRVGVSFGRLIALGAGTVYARDPETGASRGSYRIVRERHVDLAGPGTLEGRFVAFAGSDMKSEAVTILPYGQQRQELPASHLSGPALTVGKSILIAGGANLYRFDPGTPMALPSSPAEQAQMAGKLVSRFDKLIEDEQLQLVQLGPDALTPLLALLRQRALTQEKPTATMDDRSRFQDVLKIVTRMMRPEYTKPLLGVVEVLPANTDPLGAYADILRLLAAKGNDSLTMPLFLKVADTGSVPGLDGPFEAAMIVLGRSKDPAAIAYLTDHLHDPEGKTRETAYRTLAGNGGDAGVAAVRPMRLPMPELADAPRAVIAAAVEAHYHFVEKNPLPVVVELPKGLDPFEMPGFSWITVREYGVALDYGTHTVRITPPAMDLYGAACYPDDGSSPIIWNEDKTQAKLGLKVCYDAHTASPHDITLQKFGDDWLVTGYEEIEE